MTYQIDCEPDGLVRVVISGRVTWGNLNGAAPRVLSKLREAGLDRALFDFRDTELEMGTLDIRDFAAGQARTGYAGLKRALVVNRNTPDYAFYENTSRNLGQHLRVFSDIDEARAWLLQDAPAPVRNTSA